MNLLLFETAEGKYFFVGERFQVLADPDPDAPVSFWRRLMRQIRTAYAKLKNQFDYSERLCGSLRHARELRVIHDTRRSALEVEKILRDFLQLSYSKHSRWLAVDATLAFLGGGLFWVPGPNVFFFYPAVRALSHYFARSGAARAMHLSKTFEADGRLDQVRENMDNLQSCSTLLSELEEAYNLETLLSLLENLRKK